MRFVHLLPVINVYAYDFSLILIVYLLCNEEKQIAETFLLSVVRNTLAMVVELGMESRKLSSAMEYTEENVIARTGQQTSSQKTFQENVTNVAKPERCKTQTTDFSSYTGEGIAPPSREVLNHINVFNLRQQDKRMLQRSHSAIVEGSNTCLRDAIVPMLQPLTISPPPYSDAKSNPAVEVTHYPLNTNKANLLESNASSSYLLQNQHTQAVIEHPPPQQAIVPIEKQPPCRCTCHHTHHHHHHHTIFINGKPVEHLPSNGVTDSSPTMQGPSKVEVLKTSSCPAWADGSPRSDEPAIRNYNTNNNTNLKEGVTESGESSSSKSETKYTAGCNSPDKTVNECQTHHNNTHNNENYYETIGNLNSSHIKKRQLKCHRMSNGMILLLVTLFIIIASLLSALTYFRK